MKHLFHVYGRNGCALAISLLRDSSVDADRDGSITPHDFDLIAGQLSSLVGQEDVRRREDYANARKVLCQEIMRADANNDGKVTMGKRAKHRESF